MRRVFRLVITELATPLALALTTLAMWSAPPALQAQTARPAPRTGVIVDERGEPLGGVAIDGMPSYWEETKADGRFVAAPTDDVRFSKRGFVPRTLPWSRLPDTIVLRALREPERHVPVCSPDVASDPRFASLTVRVVLPPSARTRRGGFEHGQSIVVPVPGGWIRVLQGLWWSAGKLGTFRRAQVALVQERDWILPDDRVLADYRGWTTDGRRFRYLRTFDFAVEYEGVQPELARGLDDVIDTVCMVEPARAR